MSDVPLVRTLCALPALRLRTGWLREHLGLISLERAALELSALCEASERGVPEAREALLAVAVVVAGMADSERVRALRELAAERRYLGLERVLRWHDTSERGDVVERVPDYGAGRELTLGERRSLARRPDRRSFEQLLSDPHPLVIRQLLGNPKLTEDDVVRIAARRPARVPAIQEIFAHEVWLCRPRVRMALVQNPGTPAEASIPLVGLCTRSELHDVRASSDVHATLREIATELLERRPPLPEPAAGWVLQ